MSYWSYGMKKIKLKLYISGRTAKSVKAIANLKRICEEEFKKRIW